MISKHISASVKFCAESAPFRSTSNMLNRSDRLKSYRRISYYRRASISLSFWAIFTINGSTGGRVDVSGIEDFKEATRGCVDVSRIGDFK